MIRKSGKPLYKLAKIKITRVTDHFYTTEKEKVCRKNHLSLRHNFNHPKFSATPATVGERLQRRIAPRPQPQPSASPAQRQKSEPPKCKVMELTAEPSSEDSLITGPQLELVEAPVTAPQGLAPADVTSKALTVQSLTNPASTGVQATPQDPPITIQPQTSGTVPQTATQGPAATGHTEDGDLTTHSTSDSTRSSGRSQKTTRFSGDPLRHSVKSVTESDPAESSSQQPIPKQTITTPFTPIVRKGSQLPFPRTKEQTTPFKKIRIDEFDKNS